MKQNSKKPISLPSCGTFIGTGIMNSVADYLVISGRAHTCWVPQLFSPAELLEKIIEDNQGNLVQYWGFDGGISPVTFARHYALEDLGMTAPEPDWEKLENLTVEQWINREDYAERCGAGVLKFIEAAAAKELYTILLYTDAHPQWSQQFEKAGGPFYLGYDFGERFTFRLEEEHFASDLDRTLVTLRTVAEDLIRRVREHVTERRSAGWGNVMATSGNFYLDYEVAGGVDVPLTEDFGFSHLNMASSLARGLYRQYDLPIWGAHLAHEHYSWIPYSNEHKFDLFRAGMFQKYMAGSKIILNESGGWYLEALLVEDSPMFQTPRLELGDLRERSPHLSAPYVKEARKAYDKINYHSPVAQRYRKEISDFYNYVKLHGTPEGQPEVTIALAKGNFDLCWSEYSPNSAIGGLYSMAEKNPYWFDGAPERGWNIVKDVFYPRPPVLDPHPNRFLSGTPYGMLDIASFAQDHANAEFLSRYKALLFSGWNTASESQYQELCRYVQNGGILFISIPHLSTNETRNYNDYTVSELVRGGDFSELCGVKVKGKGARFYWATAPDHQGTLGFKFPRRFGIMATCLGDIEIVDPTAEVLVVDDEEMRPLLLRRKYGEGEVYFLNSWAYPGAINIDEGPGATNNSPGLIGMIYRHIARKARGYVWITDDGEDAGEECRYIAHSYFPDAGKICLQNIDFRKPHRCILHQGREVESIELGPGEFRIITTNGAHQTQTEGGATA